MVKKKHLVSKPKISANKFFLIVFPILLIGGLAVLFLSARRSSDLAEGCGATDLSGLYQQGEQEAYIDGQSIPVPKEIASPAKLANNVLGEEDKSNHWIEVNLSEQKLTAWDGNSVFLETPISTGLPWSPTPTGEFYIWIKLRYTRMEGGEGKYYYNLPNVPYTMFFENANTPAWKGYSLHGTYWHHDFGRPHSHGCVNLPTPVAEKLFYWTEPDIVPGKGVVKSTSVNPGTRIVIHK